MKTRTKKYKNKLNHVIKASKKMCYEDQLIKYKHNTKMIWKTLNNTLNKEKKNQIYQNSSLIICHLTS